MDRIEYICVSRMERIRDNFIKNYPFVYIDESIDCIKWQIHEFLCKIDYAKSDVKSIIERCLGKEDEIILSMARYNDREKYSGKTFVEISDYAANRALQANRLHSFGLLGREDMWRIISECFQVVSECREHVFSEYDIIRVNKSYSMVKELIEWL